MANTVESVKGPSAPWGEDFPKMTTYDLKVSGFEGTVFRYLPEDAPDEKKPKVGDVGRVDTSGKKPKFVPGGGAEAGPRDDATGRSIERQVAAKAAAEMAAVVGGPAPEIIENFKRLFDVTLAKIQDIGGGGQSPAAGLGENSQQSAAPSDALSPERAKKVEEAISAAGMTTSEVRIMLGAAGIEVGDDLHKAIASMTPGQATSIEQFVEAKQAMAAA